MLSPKPIFTVGQKVKLNSGGPDLFVDALDGSFVQVSWEGENGRQRAQFPQICLMLA